MEVEIVFDDLKERTKKSISGYVSELNNLRAGRANVHILDGITAEYYGVETPLNQLGNITVPEARIIMITVWDASALKKVEKALVDANLGITPNNDGKNIRLIFPELTEERRKMLVKDVKAKSEQCKIAIRNIRRDAMSDLKALEKDKVITEDMMKTYEEDVDKVISAKISEIERITSEKEQEILTI
jgi:ribosome recycling factor